MIYSRVSFLVATLFFFSVSVAYGMTPLVVEGGMEASSTIASSKARLQIKQAEINLENEKILHASFFLHNTSAMDIDAVYGLQFIAMENEVETISLLRYQYEGDEVVYLPGMGTKRVTFDVMVPRYLHGKFEVRAIASEYGMRRFADIRDIGNIIVDGDTSLASQVKCTKEDSSIMASCRLDFLDSLSPELPITARMTLHHFGRLGPELIGTSTQVSFLDRQSGRVTLSLPGEIEAGEYELRTMFFDARGVLIAPKWETALTIDGVSGTIEYLDIGKEQYVTGETARITFQGRYRGVSSLRYHVHIEGNDGYCGEAEGEVTERTQQVIVSISKPCKIEYVLVTIVSQEGEVIATKELRLRTITTVRQAPVSPLNSNILISAIFLLLSTAIFVGLVKGGALSRGVHVFFIVFVFSYIFLHPIPVFAGSSNYEAFAVWANKCIWETATPELEVVPFVTFTCASSGGDTCFPGETVNVGIHVPYSVWPGWGVAKGRVAFNVSVPSAGWSHSVNQGGLTLEGSIDNVSSFSAPASAGTYSSVGSVTITPEQDPIGHPYGVCGGWSIGSSPAWEGGITVSGTPYTLCGLAFSPGIGCDTPPPIGDTFPDFASCNAEKSKLNNSCTPSLTCQIGPCMALPPVTVSFSGSRVGYDELRNRFVDGVSKFFPQAYAGGVVDLNANCNGFLDLDWRTTGSPTNCVSSNKWSGPKDPAGGIEHVSPVGPANAGNYNIHCWRGLSHDYADLNLTVASCNPGAIWTLYCTGGSDPINPWEWWEYDNSTPTNYRFIRDGDGACTPPNAGITWTPYCTGGSDPINPWEWWEYDNSTPTNYRFIRDGDGACVPPPPVSCPNAVCEPGLGESCSNCSSDCGSCPPGITWTPYCTGGSDPINPWEWWEYDNSTPTNYRFIRDGDGACTPPNACTSSGNFCSGTERWEWKCGCTVSPGGGWMFNPSGSPASCYNHQISPNDPTCVVPTGCGGAATSYPHTASGFSGSFCMVGSPSPLHPIFPSPGGGVSWTCGGFSCNATVANAPQVPIDGLCSPIEFTCGLDSQPWRAVDMVHNPATGISTWTCLGQNGGQHAYCSIIATGDQFKVCPDYALIPVGHVQQYDAYIDWQGKRLTDCNPATLAQSGIQKVNWVNRFSATGQTWWGIRDENSVPGGMNVADLVDPTNPADELVPDAGKVQGVNPGSATIRATFFPWDNASGRNPFFNFKTFQDEADLDVGNLAILNVVLRAKTHFGILGDGRREGYYGEYDGEVAASPTTYLDWSGTTVDSGVLTRCRVRRNGINIAGPFDFATVKTWLVPVGYRIFSARDYTVKCFNAYADRESNVVTLAPPPPPTQLQAFCDPSGTQATLMWQLPSGYTDSYFRNAKGNAIDPAVCTPLPIDPATTDGACLAPFNGNTITIPVTPGSAYTAWVHTANQWGSWSNIISRSFTCTQTVPTVSVVVTPPGGNVPNFGVWKVDMTSENAVACQYSRSGTYPGNWNGVMLPGVSYSTGNQSWAGPGNVTYSFRCRGNNGIWTNWQNGTVTIGGTLPPTVNISANPASVIVGATSEITWVPADATSCVASDGSAGWVGARDATTGSHIFTTGPLLADTQFTISCTGPGGSTGNRSVVVMVTPPPVLSFTCPNFGYIDIMRLPPNRIQCALRNTAVGSVPFTVTMSIMSEAVPPLVSPPAFFVPLAPIGPLVGGAAPTSVSVTLNPTPKIHGDYEAVLRATPDFASGIPFQEQLVTAQSPIPITDSHDFGAVRVGKCSTNPWVLTIKNPNPSLVITGGVLKLEPTVPTPFYFGPSSASPQEWPYGGADNDLDPGEPVTFNIYFCPDAVTNYTGSFEMSTYPGKMDIKGTGKGTPSSIIIEEK